MAAPRLEGASYQTVLHPASQLPNPGPQSQGRTAHSIKTYVMFAGTRDQLLALGPSYWAARYFQKQLRHFLDHSRTSLIFIHIIASVSFASTSYQEIKRNRSLADKVSELEPIMHSTKTPLPSKISLVLVFPINFLSFQISHYTMQSFLYQPH